LIQFYADENVRGAIIRGLRRRGVGVITVQEDGLAGADDHQVLDRATELGWVLFTQDDDLLRVSTERQRRQRPFAGVIYAHQQHVTIGKCVQDLEVIAAVGQPEELADQVWYLPL
jgi:predicted nuclease of predicted toxin-antitoxin system